MIVAVADTHAIVWYLFGDDRLSSNSRLFIDAAARDGNQIAVASITLVELVYLIEKGRISEQTLSRLVGVLRDSQNMIVEVPLELSIAQTLAKVSANQIPDMPDRIIAATGAFLNVPVISRDHRIRSSDIETIW